MEPTESCSEPRAKRQKTNHKTAVFERLKALKGKGIKNKYEVDNVDNVYEVLDEKEYSKKVWERQDDDWIVDDDGSGYVEDGRDIFDDDLDSESIANATKNNGKNKKKKQVSKAAGKNIQAMLSSMPEKKKEAVNLDHDDILSDVLSGLDDTSAKPSKSNNFSLIAAEDKSAKDYMNSFTVPRPLKIKRPSQLPKKVSEPLKEIKHNIDNSNSDYREGIVLPEVFEEEEKDNVSEFDTSECCTDMFEDDFEYLDEEEEKRKEEKIKEKRMEDEKMEANLESGWDKMQSELMNETTEEIVLDCSELPLVTNAIGEQVFRFYWWDAYEDVYNQPGVVFLLGKTYVESKKCYVSCCVIVRNIERKLFLLPRPFYVTDGNITTDKPVKIIDVYNEFNNVIAEALKIEQFRSRKVTKKFAFDPNIPRQSDYLEVRYSAEKQSYNTKYKAGTFSHVFGVDSSYLEILLVDRKIKGPCWLDVKTPKPVINPLSWCQFELSCAAWNLSVVSEQKLTPPPLVVATINIRTVLTKDLKDEIVMIGCLVHNHYFIDKAPPNPQFQQHFCAFAKPSSTVLPVDCHEALRTYKGTKVQKCDSERAMLNYFLNNFAKIDPDLVVGHELLDYQLGLLCTRLKTNKTTNWSRFGKLKRKTIPTMAKGQKNLMIGRLVCDLKISARELIKSRSYDLETLCTTVLKLKEGERPTLQSRDVLNMFGNSEYMLKLISLTMQDAAYITKMMYELNVMPLALQITQIAGYVLSKTLLGGRAARNEYLLLHAFNEKDFIVPERKQFTNNKKVIEEPDDFDRSEIKPKKKAAYSGGLVLDPKIGFYDKLILLMDFNSLYPSIIQEYNICFTTIPSDCDSETVLSNVSGEPGILPTEIRKLVESRREVKKLMSNPDISSDLRMQYNIRQLALKLTANSMYGCLGFSNSRFFAMHLASLITMKGRDILMHTRDLVQSLGYDVVYGDTDSIMINTNITDYEQVFKIGSNIKQAVNKFYRQVELDVDGVFKYMLLLKKKKYAAVTMSKSKTGDLILTQEHKGLDIVRRDWSMLASEVGKMVLNHLLSEQTADERIENVQSVLTKITNDLTTGQVPLPLLIITKQLTKDPALYTDKTVSSHVIVALRFNKKGGKPLGHGDAVPYIICEDGTTNSATQRAYHVDEFKQSTELKVDIKYYLSQQIHPVVSRLCEPIEGLDAYQIANALGIDGSSFKKTKPKAELDVTTIAVRSKSFKNTTPLEFTCVGCKETNRITTLTTNNETGVHVWLEKCANPNCMVRPISYLNSIQTQLLYKIRGFIEKYYEKILICEDPVCPNETDILPLRFIGKYPVCDMCSKGFMYRKYSERDLYEQLCYYKHLCDVSKLEKKTSPKLEAAYQSLKECIDFYLLKSGYAVINLTDLYRDFNIFERKFDLTTDLPEMLDLEENEDDEF